MAGTTRELMTVVRRRQVRYLRHVFRGGDSVERDCLFGMIDRRRTQGRQRMKYMDGMKEITGRQKVDEVVNLAGDRSVWYSIAANVN